MNSHTALEVGLLTGAWPDQDATKRGDQPTSDIPGQIKSEMKKYLEAKTAIVLAPVVISTPESLRRASTFT